VRFSLFGEGAQISRFSLVGAFSVTTYYALFYGLTEYAHVWYIASAMVAFGGYYVVSFTLQKYWAFRNRSKERIRQQLAQFSLMAVGNWILNTSLLYVLVEYFGMWYLLAQGILTVVVSIIAYFALRWIFRHD
jgi:putative flippase GtrA